MSSNMGTNIICLIERIDRHPRNMPAIRRRGYGVEVVGIAMQGGCTEDAVNQGADEVAQLRHREILCGDIIATVCELSQKATIYKNVEVVVNKDAFVNENDVDIDDFRSCPREQR